MASRVHLLSSASARGTIQLFDATKCPFLDVLQQQISELYLLANASLSKVMSPCWLINAKHEQ